MLLNLAVRNFALVTELAIPLSSGLTVITGESGAGKTILLNALSLVLGGRASKSQIRPGAQQCEVIAEFSVERVGQVDQFLRSFELGDASDPSAIVVRRIAGVDGRSRAWINSIPVNLSALRQLCQLLVEIHGQFAQQQLLNTETQLAWLDDYVGDPGLVAEVQRHYDNWQSIKTQYQVAEAAVQRAAAHRELLDYQVGELDALNLGPTEFEDLTAQYKRHSNQEVSKLQIRELRQRLEDQIVPLVSQFQAELNRFQGDDAELQATQDFFETAEINLEEASSSLQSYDTLLHRENVPIEDISSRLDKIHDLSRKHKIHPRDLYAHQQDLHNELNRLVGTAQDLQKLSTKVSYARQQYTDTASELSTKRQQAKSSFCTAVIDTLNTLGMHDVDFKIDFRAEEHARGLERIEYLVSPNSKYAPTSLKETASGGEISRISLAILVVVSKASKLPCLILDEADIGIGGTTADTLGRMLYKLAQESQVVCVTHAPQVAALGQTHLQVVKSSEQDIQIDALDATKRIEEIARMVGGRRVNQEARDYAQTLLREATMSE